MLSRHASYPSLSFFTCLMSYFYMFSFLSFRSSCSFLTCLLFFLVTLLPFYTCWLTLNFLMLLATLVLSCKALLSLPLVPLASFLKYLLSLIVNPFFYFVFRRLHIIYSHFFSQKNFCFIISLPFA
jgi:hypothetical protein